jgi:NAD(P)-dependent dehydrogenase (short-subunit alcohol dehydrogenase family)
VTTSSRVTAVSGGSGGIGAAIVRARRARGESVIVLDREIGEFEHDAGVSELACDVSSERDVIKAFAEIDRLHGRLDAFIAAAGVMSLPRLADLDADEWDRVAAVNLRGLLITCREALSRMTRGGRLVIMSSAAGLNASSVTGIAYAMSKAAAVHLARSLAAEYGPQGICVNAVCPGAVETPMSAVFPAEALRTAAAMNPSGRILQPDGVAATVDFLLSDEGIEISGEALALGTLRR